MRTYLVTFVAAVTCFAIMGPVAAEQSQADAPHGETSGIRFAAVNLMIDTKDQPLAAYQLDFKAAAGAEAVKIVGIEGGEHKAFSKPPYYDPKAMQHNRVIIARFSTAEAKDLPHGKTRIATIHLQITGKVEPDYAVGLTTSATVDGRKIPAKATIEKGS